MRQYGSIRSSNLDRQAATVAGAGLAVASLVLLYAYRRHRTRQPYNSLQWQEAIQPDGTITGLGSIAQTVAKQGLDPWLRAELWPFLLDVFSPDSTCEQRQEQHVVMVEQYQSLLLQCQAHEAAMAEHLQQVKLSSPSSINGVPSGRSSPEQLAPSPPPHVVQFSEAHRIIVIDAVRTDFRKHSIAGVAPGASGIGDRDHNSSSSNGGFYRTPNGSSAALAGLTDAVSTAAAHVPWLHSWLGLTDPAADAQASPAVRWVSLVTQQVLDASHHLTPELKQQVVRMVAILSAYAVHDPATGYCQGMSDLLLPLLVLFDDDALAFWCFASVMQTCGLRRNFAVDESGIFGQLRALSSVLGCADATVAHKLRTIGAAECHFAYRMIVVLMRRDLPLAQVAALWDVLWADTWCCRHLWQAPERPGATADEDTPQVLTSRAGMLPEQLNSRPGSADKLLAAAWSPQGAEPTLFTCFVAAVVLGQKRRILEDCRDADDVMRLCHSLRFIDFPACLHKAHQLRAAYGGKLR